MTDIKPDKKAFREDMASEKARLLGDMASEKARLLEQVTAEAQAAKKANEATQFRLAARAAKMVAEEEIRSLEYRIAVLRNFIRAADDVYHLSVVPPQMPNEFRPEQAVANDILREAMEKVGAE